MKPCTLGKRHRWQFVKNAIQVTNGVRTAKVSQRGIYRCECGSRKYGEAREWVEPVSQPNTDAKGTKPGASPA